MDHLGAEAHRRWVRTAIAITLVAYAAVLASDFLLFGPAGRPAAVVGQALVVLAGLVALHLAYRNRHGTAAILTLAAVWLELQSGIPFTGAQGTALVGLPIVVSAAGILLGSRVAWGLAAITTLTLAALAGWATAARPGLVDPAAEQAYLVIVTSAAMLAGAALVQLGLDAFGSVLRSARASERRLADMLAHAPDGVIATGSDGIILSVNPAAERILGRRPGALLGDDLRRVLEIAHEEGDLPALGDEPAPPEDAIGLPLRLRGADGAIRIVEAKANTLTWADGSRGHQLTLRDITERQRAQEAQELLRERLAHAQRLEAVGRLAGGVAHEFNNLLTVVGGAAELLVAETEGSNRELAAAILEAKVRGAALTKQLLAFASKDVILPRRLFLTEVARDMQELLGRFLSDRVRFTLDAPVEAPPVVAEVMNAKDAIPGHGSVTVAIRRESIPRSWNGHDWTVPCGFVEISVIDDGCGMGQATLEHVFEPFFSTKPRGRGTGLGLATVHGTVVQNGGRIRILSEPGSGTAVVVHWPVAEGA